jgi:hypothetical protein
VSLLPAAESWNSETFENRRRFLSNCVVEWDRLSAELSYGREEEEPAREISGLSERERPQIADCLTEAAELAFCRNLTSAGLANLDEAIRVLGPGLKDNSTIPQLAVFAALTRLSSVEVSVQGIRMLGSRNAGIEFYSQWLEMGAMDHVVQALPILVLAALSWGEKFAPILFSSLGEAKGESASSDRPQREGDGFAVRAALSAGLSSPLFDVLGLLGIDFTPRTYLRGERPGAAGHVLFAMERGYEARIELMRGDSHWQQVRPRAEIIDWMLLMIHVAILHRQTTRFLDDLPPAGEASEFIRSLAQEIVGQRGEIVDLRG